MILAWASPFKSFFICFISRLNHCFEELNECLFIKICKCNCVIVNVIVGRDSETQLQVGEITFLST